MHGDRDGNTFATLWAPCLEMPTSLCAQPVTRVGCAQEVPKASHRNPLRAQEPPSCTGTPPLPGQELSQEPHRNPPSCTGRPFLDPSWTPSCTGTPPPFLHKNPLRVPFSRHFLHRNPPPSGTWCFCVLPRWLPSQTVSSSQTPLSHRGIATTHAMQLRPCLERLGISVVPPRVKLCEAPRSWHHLTRPAHDVTSILRDCQAQN